MTDYPDSLPALIRLAEGALRLHAMLPERPDMREAYDLAALSLMTAVVALKK